MAADVDFEAVAQMCEGYSGDDMTNICRDAAMNGMRTLIAGKTPDQIRQEALMPLREPHEHQAICASESWRYFKGIQRIAPAMKCKRISVDCAGPSQRRRRTSL